jgi:hypothetical protein
VRSDAHTLRQVFGRLTGLQPLPAPPPTNKAAAAQREAAAKLALNREAIISDILKNAGAPLAPPLALRRSGCCRPTWRGPTSGSGKRCHKRHAAVERTFPATGESHRAACLGACGWLGILPPAGARCQQAWERLLRLGVPAGTPPSNPAAATATTAGLTRYRGSPYGATAVSVNGGEPVASRELRAAVDLNLRRVASQLLTGGPRRCWGSCCGAARGAM